jgi:hypothetical protein
MGMKGDQGISGVRVGRGVKHVQIWKHIPRHFAANVGASMGG